MRYLALATDYYGTFATDGGSLFSVIDDKGTERDAIAAVLKQIPHIESVPVNQKEQVNFIIGRMVKPATPVSVPMQVYSPAGFFEVLVITCASPLRETLQGLQAIARGRGLKRGEPITFDGKTRGANDSEDSIVQATSSLVRDITRAGGGIAPVATRGLDPKQSGVFSAILQVVN